MKKLFIALASAIALTGTISLTACAKNSSIGTDKFENLKTAQSVYGFSAASAGMIISDMNESTPQVIPEQGNQTTPEQGTTGGQTTTDQGNQTAPDQGAATTSTELDGYMTLVDSLLSDGGFNTSSEQSDRAEYSEKLVVTYRNMQNEQNYYTLYYNQVLSHSEQERDEIEETFNITGIMLVDGKEYPIRGEREVSSERRESEVETEFRVTLNDTSYMLVEQSQEDDDGESSQEFSYSIYENGRLKERSSFEYEEERGETELKMTCLRDGQSDVICFERETVRGREVIRLRTGSGRQQRSYIVEKKTDANGNSYYEYTPDNSRYDD